MYAPPGTDAAIQLYDASTGAGIETSTIPGEVLSQGSIGLAELWSGYGTTNNEFVYADVASQAVPEPTSLTLALLGAGVLSGAGFARWRRRKLGAESQHGLGRAAVAHYHNA
jgi:hypothetical protein